MTSSVQGAIALMALGITAVSGRVKAMVCRRSVLDEEAVVGTRVETMGVPPSVAGAAEIRVTVNEKDARADGDLEKTNKEISAVADLDEANDKLQGNKRRRPVVVTTGFKKDMVNPYKRDGQDIWT